MTQRRKLIEVALPLEAINREAAREKSIRHGHPSTLHLWWARRPLAAARAVLFAQLVDDPASRPEADAISDDDERAAWISTERTRLFRLIEQLVTWENSTNEHVLAQARTEIVKSTDGNPPIILDPFAGGGTIPLEAQRLGLQVRASDLNPVAVLINRALLDFPPRFTGRAPVFPGAVTDTLATWPSMTGLADDVRRYGSWIREQAIQRVGHLYPPTTLPNGVSASVIAWVWARTVQCPNPACGIRMPLTRSWWLGKKKGKEAFVVPEVLEGVVHYRISTDAKRGPSKADDGTVGRTGAVCVGCGTAVDLAYIRGQGKAGLMDSQLMATVAEGQRRRHYLAPNEQHAAAARVDRPSALPAGRLGNDPRAITAPNYGMTEFADLFTNRQLHTLSTFSDLISEARDRAYEDALSASPGDMPEGERQADARDYSNAIATYLTFAFSRVLNKSSSICGWDSSTKVEGVRSVFARQAISMVWDFAEANPFGGAAGDYLLDLDWVTKVIANLRGTQPAEVMQADAASRDYGEALVTTDPPYYDNIGYADLSDFFYVWLRRPLQPAFPDLLSTLMVPKAEELVANPYRQGGKQGAQEFFEDGFKRVFARARSSARTDLPTAVFYAFKQADTDGVEVSSTGWETLLDGMVGNGWTITGTWPMRSELGNRLRNRESNALASSIVLALRPRPADAPAIDRRGLTAELRNELPARLRELQQGSIAPVDLPQAAIGPGMAVFSRYSKVIEANGDAMSVRAALQVINQILSEVLSSQEGDFDSGTRWCVKWFESYGFDPGPYGEAETLASAFNTSVGGLDRSGALSSRGGKVQLFDPAALPSHYDPRTDDHITLWEVVIHLAKTLDEEGLESAGLVMARAATRIDLDAAKELAYLLFSIAERKRWSSVAQLFNMLAASWADVLDAARRKADTASEQLVLDTAY